jgi:ketosteroid isomerase-like protein
MNPEPNTEIARRGYEAIASGDIDGVREYLDPEVKWHGGDPTAVGACKNRHDALAFIQQARERRRVGELVDVIDAGDKVVMIMRPPPRDGEPSDLAANLTTFRGGKAVEIVHYPSAEDALAAAGIAR